jgi:hypothetical protein
MEDQPADASVTAPTAAAAPAVEAIRDVGDEEVGCSTGRGI